MTVPGSGSGGTAAPPGRAWRPRPGRPAGPAGRSPPPPAFQPSGLFGGQHRVRPGIDAAAGFVGGYGDLAAAPRALVAVAVRAGGPDGDLDAGRGEIASSAGNRRPAVPPDGRAGG